MSRRVNWRDLSPILTSAQTWIATCLVKDGSVLSSGELWTPSLVEEVRQAFVEHPDLGKDDFMTKLGRQIESTSSAAKQLTAEMLWALLLFPSNIKAETKREHVREVWALSGQQLREDLTPLSDDVLIGVGSGGPGFINLLWRETGFLITLTGDLKRKSQSERHQVLSDYHAFMSWIAMVPQIGNRQYRHMLRYFAFPDRVERMSSNRDRRTILEAFGIATEEQTKNWDDRQLDDALLKLRTELQAKNPLSILDFYESPLRERWHENYFLIRSNATSKWDDEVGKVYQFGSTVPNYTKLIKGGRVIVDQRQPEGVRLLGYGTLGEAAEISDSKDKGTIFESRFLDWHAYPSPAPIPNETLGRIQALPGHNIQHAVRPITKEIFDALMAASPARGIWIFQGNPDLFDTRAAVKHLKRLGWLARQHADELAIGDRVYLWEAGPEAGIVAVAEITEPATSREEDSESKPFNKNPEKFKGTQPRVVLDIQRVIDPYLPKEVIRADPALAGLSILRAPQGTNFPVTQQQADALDVLLRPEGPAVEMDFATLASETLLEGEQLTAIIEALTGPSPQVVFAGPPGTGKTWVAQCVARYLSQRVRDGVRLVQFHPSYSYEAFVEGLRPVVKEGGGISFERQDGIVLDIVRLMQRRGHTSPTSPLYTLVIDEMNRANLPRVFGELMYLFEYRGKAIDLQYSKGFSLPPNLRFIGTMNTADRSIRSLDIALRRRFDVFEFQPSDKILERFFHERTLKVQNLIEGFNKLNAELTHQLDRHHTIGHAYFMKDALDRPMLRNIWDRKLYPLIEEYFFDQADRASQFTFEGFWPAATA